MEKIGLIAGNGIFPVLFAHEAKRRGYHVVAVAHRGESLADLENAADSVEWIRVGQIAKLARTLVRSGVKRAVMAGGVDKARSLMRLRPDWRGIRLLSRTLSRGDDALLRALADDLAHDGIEIVPCTTFLENLLCPRGLVVGSLPDARGMTDLRLGVRVLRALGDLDVGQSVVVEDGIVLAVEAIEGTDAVIRRSGALGRGRSMVVKAPKAGQDMRFDVPAVGPATIEAMTRHGATCLAVEAGKTLLLEIDRTAAMAHEHGITLLGFEGDGEVET
jgi:DUF1009 family protein